jgi:hypothetical protein
MALGSGPVGWAGAGSRRMHAQKGLWGAGNVFLVDGVMLYSVCKNSSNFSLVYVTLNKKVLETRTKKSLAQAASEPNRMCEGMRRAWV